MNVASYVVLAIIIIIAALVIYYLMKHKHSSCGGDCDHCGLGSCNHEDIYKQFYKDHPKDKQ